jgi:hypothetical protein
MTCDHFESLRTGSRLFHELSRSERIAFRDHFQSCGSCRDKVRMAASIEDLDNPDEAATGRGLGEELAILDSTVSPFEDPEAQPSDDWWQVLDSAPPPDDEMMKGG